MNLSHQKKEKRVKHPSTHPSIHSYLDNKSPTKMKQKQKRRRKPKKWPASPALLRRQQPTLKLPLFISPSLSRLTTIRSLLNLPLILHPRVNININSRRRLESKTPSHLNQIQLSDIENTSEGMRSICLEIRLISLFSTLIQVIILGNEFRELGLDIDDF